MTLTPGTRLGHYEILGPIDAGGMGQVFRARDSKLGREVAIKVLHERYAQDPDWLGRFEREARLLAALNHNHIAIVHGLDEAEGTRYLVMELVPGQTLGQRLKSGPLPLDEALDVCRQIAEALEAAHERGIIHRDLKPANVKITPEGKVKVLDFGLARSIEPASEPDNATVTFSPRTREGVIVGTPAYMAPEQARGKPVDRRCDIWALGCVLYEALTGKRPFVGETQSDVLAAVIERTPAWQALPAGVPPRVVELVRRCLQKDLQRRLRDAGDVRLEIEEALAEMARGPSTAAPAAPEPRRMLWPFLAVAVAVALFALGMWVQHWRTPEPAPPNGHQPRGARPDISADWSGQILLGASTLAFGPRVSPDGKWVAFAFLYEGQAELGVMKLSTGDWWAVTREKSRGFLNSFCWSQDSDRIYYDRFYDVPVGIYSAKPEDKGERRGKEKLILDKAECPQVTADGSLLVCRTNPDGTSRLLRVLELEEKPVLAHPVLFSSGWPPPAVRALHKRNEAVFCGKLLDGAEKSPARRLHLLDLATGKTRLLHPGPFTDDLVPLAIARDDAFVCIVLRSNDLFRIIRVPLVGEGPPETVLTLTSPVFGLDVGTDGQLYLDQFTRSLEVLRFDLKGGRPERLANLARGQVLQPVELPDQRVLLPGTVLGRDRLLLTPPGGEPTPLLEQGIETRPPATLLGADRLAFLAGPVKNAQMKLAAIADERITIVGALPEVPTTDLTTLAASPDGKELYYVHARGVWKIAAGGGTPTRLGDGDGVAVHPNGKKLVVQRFGGAGVRLFWVTLDKEKWSEISVQGDLRLAPYLIGNQAIDDKDRILVPAASRDIWFWQTALLDPGADNPNNLKRIPVQFDGDVYPANWGKDGKILAVGFPFRSELWRLTPLK